MRGSCQHRLHATAEIIIKASMIFETRVTAAIWSNVMSALEKGV